MQNNGRLWWKSQFSPPHLLCGWDQTEGHTLNKNVWCYNTWNMKATPQDPDPGLGQKTEWDCLQKTTTFRKHSFLGIITNAFMTTVLVGEYGLSAGVCRHTTCMQLNRVIRSVCSIYVWSVRSQYSHLANDWSAAEGDCRTALLLCKYFTIQLPQEWEWYVPFE